MSKSSISWARGGFKGSNLGSRSGSGGTTSSSSASSNSKVASPMGPTRAQTAARGKSQFNVLRTGK
jgi:hypothetical protein